MWSNPGGKVEDGETIEQAVAREHLEELGVTVRVIKEIGVYEDFKDGELIGKYHGCLVETVGGYPVIKEPDKIAAVKRFPLNSLPEDLAPYTRQYLADLGILF